MKKKLKIFLNNPIIYFFYGLYKRIKVFFRKAKTATKAFYRYLKWSLLEKKSFYKKLNKEFSLCDLKAFSPLHWKHGVKVFIGRIDDKKVFVKTAGKLNTISREAAVIGYAGASDPFLKESIPVLIGVGEDGTYFVEEYIDAVSLDKIDMTEEEKTKIAGKIYDIYIHLKKYGIKHLDIRPANFMVVRTENVLQIKLIDFGFGLIPGMDLYEGIEQSEEQLKIMKKLGSAYALEKGVWDDAYSFLMTIKEVNPSFMSTDYEAWLKLNEDIGSETFRL